MNERIKELAEQAGSTHKQSLGVYQFYTNELEKFAMLIVKQCGYYADVFSALGCPEDMDPTDTKPSDYIKRSMGIQE